MECLVFRLVTPHQLPKNLILLCFISNFSYNIPNLMTYCIPFVWNALLCRDLFVKSWAFFILHFLIIYCLGAPVIDVYPVCIQNLSLYFGNGSLLLFGISYVCNFLTWLLFLFILSWISMSIYLSYLCCKCVALYSLIFFHMIIFF